MRAKMLVIVLALAVLAVSVWPARQLGTEFMPNLNEGTLLYMPTTLPGISVTKAGELLQMQDRIIRALSGSGLGLWQGRAARRRRPIRRRPRCSRPWSTSSRRNEWRSGHDASTA